MGGSMRERRTLGSRILAANAAILGAGDLGAVEDFFAPDYVAHGTDGVVGSGLDMVRAFLGTLRRAFPDLVADVEILVDGKERVAWQRRWHGTQDGPFKGFPASGRRITWRDMVVTRFHDDLIAEDWVITDLAERLLLARKR